MTFPFKSLGIVIAIYLTIFFSWVDGTDFPTASQLGMSQFPTYFHTVDVTDISCSRTMFTWRKFFGPQKLISLLATRHPRSKLHLLMSSNEHKGCESKYLTVWRNKPAKLLAESVLRHSCVLVLLFPSAKSVIPRMKPLFLPSEILSDLSGLWDMHLLDLCHRKTSVYGSQGLGVWPSLFLPLGRQQKSLPIADQKGRGNSVIQCTKQPSQNALKVHCNTYITLLQSSTDTIVVYFTLQNTSGAIIEHRYISELCDFLMGLEMGGNSIRNA